MNPAEAGDRLSTLRQAARWMAVSWLVWTLVALIDVMPAIVSRRSGAIAREGEFFRSYVASHTSLWYAWWILTPVVFWLADRFPPRARSWAVPVCVHIVAALVLANAGRSVANLALIALGIPVIRFRELSIVGFLQYGGILAVALTVKMQRRERDHAVMSARLAAELAEARSEAVSAQLRPHFVYNALNSIAMLIRARANDAALEAVLGYSELLREAVRATATDVALRDELALIEKYVAIERMRFPDSFSSTMVLANDAADAVVPSFILQPIVENALRHGLSALDRNALLEVRGSRRDAAVRLEVRDNGVGLPPRWRLENGSGVGLRTTRSRLHQRYGDAHHFELHSPPEGGTVVILEIPYSRDTETVRA